MVKKVFIAGGSGFLGKHVERLFSVEENIEILAPRRSDLDLQNKTETRKFFEQHRPELVINCAGLCGGVKANIERPADFLSVNLEIGLNLLSAAHTAGAKKFVDVSSACSYPVIVNPMGSGMTPAQLWDGRPSSTHAAYGLAKRTITEAALAYKRQHGIDVSTLICANLYGPGDKFDNPQSHVIPAIISKVATAQRHGHDFIQLWGNPNVSRDFLYVEDASRAIRYFADRETDGPINIGTGIPISVGEIVRIVSGLFNFKGTPIYEHPERSGEYVRIMDVSEMTKAGFKPEYGIVKGLAITVESYQKSKAVTCY